MDSVCNAPVMLFELDPRGTVALLAGGLTKRLELHPQEAVGRNILDGSLKSRSGFSITLEAPWDQCWYFTLRCLSTSSFLALRSGRKDTLADSLQTTGSPFCLENRYNGSIPGLNKTFL